MNKRENLFLVKIEETNKLYLVLDFYLNNLQFIF